MSLFFVYLSRRRMKARAPPPPPQAPQPAPRQVFRSSTSGGGGVSGTDAKEANILRPDVELQLSLPRGYKTLVTEDGRWEDADGTHCLFSQPAHWRSLSETTAVVDRRVPDGTFIQTVALSLVLFGFLFKWGPHVGVSATTSTQALSAGADRWRLTSWCSPPLMSFFPWTEICPFPSSILDKTVFE